MFDNPQSKEIKNGNRPMMLIVSPTPDRFVEAARKLHEEECAQCQQAHNK